MTCAIAAGCSDRDSAQETLSPTPLITAPPQAAETPTAVQIQAGGMAAQYVPYFTGEELRKITERREGAAKPSEYHFQGARLLRYRGVSLQSETPIELEFDLKGSLVKSRGADAPVADEEVAAVRNRAQILRSHALAQRATHSHTNQ
jgi:hypothetical protein